MAQLLFFFARCCWYPCPALPALHTNNGSGRLKIGLPTKAKAGKHYLCYFLFLLFIINFISSAVKKNTTPVTPAIKTGRKNFLTSPLKKMSTTRIKKQNRAPTFEHFFQNNKSSLFFILHNYILSHFLYWPHLRLASC
jgi:hypothetical protein